MAAALAGSVRPEWSVKDLSIRETQIIRLIAAGMTTKAIAATLSIAESTVNWHVGNVLTKLGASSRAEAVAIVLRDGDAAPPVVIVRPRAPRRSRWSIAAAAAIGLLLALAGGTSVAAWYLGAHRDAPSRNEAPPAYPVATETPGATPSAGTASGSPRPNSGVDPAADPAANGSAASAPVVPASTPRIAAPTVTLVPTPLPLPTVPLPIPSIPPPLGRGPLP
jgi:DNA-binding CsgD family transcriptional regulator